jgi:hypothetical protein
MASNDHDEPRLGRPARLGTWSQQQADDFDLARQTLSALIGAYSARIAAAEDALHADRLRAARASYADERRALGVNDDAAVARILREYPALVRQIGEGAGG